MRKSEFRKSAALSAQARLWQSRACLARACLAGLWVALGWATPAQAAPGGSLGTLPLGRYICELPGSATGPAGVRQAEADFTIMHASSYAVGDDTGTYLLTGDLAQMTSGPQKGVRYRRISENFLRRLNADGSESPLRCVRSVPNNGG